MGSGHWIVKQEPSTYSWTDFVRDGRTAWTGVRNYQARNNLRLMQTGDPALFYHSGADKELVGLARVVRSAYPDPTATEGDWVCVDLAPVQPLLHPVTLATIRTQPALANLPLIRNSRLSVLPVSKTEFQLLLQLSKTASTL